MKTIPNPNDAIQVLRIDDPRCAELERAGWSRLAESWGARLRIELDTDLDLARSAVAAAPADVRFEELSADAAERVHQLDQATIADYPVTPQNAPEHRSRADIEALWSRGARVFGAVCGAELLGMTVVDRDGDRAETDFTAVERAARGQGIASALKAYSVLTLAGEGVTVFGTGGADANGASIAMNQRVGYVIEERWVSLAPPRRLPVWKLLLGSLSGGFLGLLVVTLGFVLISLVVGGEFVAGRTVGIMKVTLLPGSIVSVLLTVGVAWPVVLAGERFEWVWRSRFWIAALAGVVCAATIYFGYTTSLTGSFPGVLLGGVAWFVVIIAGPVAVISATGGALAGALARRPRMLVAALCCWVFLVVLAFIMPIPMPPQRYNSYEPSSQMRGLQNHRGEVSGGGFA